MARLERAPLLVLLVLVVTLSGAVSTMPPSPASASVRPAAADAPHDPVLERARPTAGAIGPDGTVLFAYTSGRSDRNRRPVFRVFDPSGRVTATGLVPRLPHVDRFQVEAYARGFVLSNTYFRTVWRVTRSGRLSRVPIDGPPTAPAPGDVLLDGGWLFRPSTNRVHRRPLGPPGATVAHVDELGVWWARGAPEAGQAVVWSARPGEAWTRHVVGAWSDPVHGCACDASPGPHGRGAVLTLVGDRLHHVSLDHGRTWRTWDIGETEPYLQTLAGNRYPTVSALPDGRLVIGYFSTGFWVGTDATNTAYVRGRHYPKRVLWRAGLTDELVYRGDEASPDGGRTWRPYR